jgi:hypothetical protein
MPYIRTAVLIFPVALVFGWLTPRPAHADDTPEIELPGVSGDTGSRWKDDGSPTAVVTIDRDGDVRFEELRYMELLADLRKDGALPPEAQPLTADQLQLALGLARRICDRSHRAPEMSIPRWERPVSRVRLLVRADRRAPWYQVERVRWAGRREKVIRPRARRRRTTRRRALPRARRRTIAREPATS